MFNIYLLKYRSILSCQLRRALMALMSIIKFWLFFLLSWTFDLLLFMIFSFWVFISHLSRTFIPINYYIYFYSQFSKLSDPFFRLDESDRIRFFRRGIFFQVTITMGWEYFRSMHVLDGVTVNIAKFQTFFFMYNSFNTLTIECLCFFYTIS